MFARFAAVLCCLAAIVPAAAAAENEYKVESLDQKPPETLSEHVRASLKPDGLRLLEPDGSVLFDVWFVKEAELKPNFRPTSTVKYPFVAGGLVGAIRFPDGGGHDFREQAIPAGVYTLRYALQPVDGNHLGTSPYQDFLAMIPPDLDTDTKAMPAFDLEQSSKESTEALTHPGILSLQPPSPKRPETATVRKAGDYWILSTQLGGKAAEKATQVNFDLVVVGHAVE